MRTPTLDAALPRFASSARIKSGEVSERLKELASKASSLKRARGFKSHPLRHFPILRSSRRVHPRPVASFRLHSRNRRRACSHTGCIVVAYDPGRTLRFGFHEYATYCIPLLDRWKPLAREPIAFSSMRTAGERAGLVLKMLDTNRQSMSKLGDR